MTRLRKFLLLPFYEKRFVFQAFYYLVVYSVYLKISSLDNLLKKVTNKSQFLLLYSDKKISVNRISRLIVVVSSFIPFSTCLSRALAGQLLFARQGWKTSLHFGVRNSNDTSLEAHSWLCYNDKIILGMLPDILSYQELPLIFIR